MKTIDKLMDQVVIPVIRGGLVGGITLGATSFVVDPPWPYFISMVTGGLDLLIEFERRTPKEFKQPIFKKVIQPGGLSNFAQTANVVNREHRVKVWLENPGKWAQVFESSVDVKILARIGWHLTYLNGRISHPYLHKGWNILDRLGVEDLQRDLVTKGWGQFRGRENKGGIRLSEEGVTFFRSIGREYGNKTKEEISQFEKIFGHTWTPEKRLEVARRVTGKPIREIKLSDIALELG